MHDFAAALRTAVDLILGFDAELRDIVLLSLAVSLTASACAFVIGAPLGTALAVYRFRGRGALVVAVNALLGLPPVVVGLIKDWVEKKVRRHLAHAQKRRGFGWERWSRPWLYNTLKLFHGYRVRRDGPKVARAG